MENGKMENPFAWNETIQELLSDKKASDPSVTKSYTSIDGCECCIGDEALYWKDNENNAFVDSKGEVLVTVKDHIIRFKVKCCPNCGRKFGEERL